MTKWLEIGWFVIAIQVGHELGLPSGSPGAGWLPTKC
jgi:hypothetical protein